MILWVSSRISEWSERRRALRQARFEAELAEIQASAKLAFHKARADIEWDMKWAHEDGRHTFRDEALIILWAIPPVLLFIPSTRPGAVEALAALKEFAPEAPTVFVVGWIVILAAVFGVKQLVGLFMPGKFATLAKALGSITPDVPTDAPEAPSATTTEPRTDAP